MEIQRVFEDGAQRGVSKRFTSNDTHVLRPGQLITPPNSTKFLTANSPTLGSCDPLSAPGPSRPFNLFPAPGPPRPFNLFLATNPSTPQRANPTPPSNIQRFQHPQAQQILDTTGQVAPPGVKPRVTATLWEDEGSLCFQVEAKGVCVARREDNHFINGTKLLNVAGMTRTRRDGILKSEKTRHTVKIGPMHLKGVW
jgi:protein SOK2